MSFVQRNDEIHFLSVAGSPRPDSVPKVWPAQQHVDMQQTRDFFCAQMSNSFLECSYK